MFSTEQVYTPSIFYMNSAVAEKTSKSIILTYLYIDVVLNFPIFLGIENNAKLKQSKGYILCTYVYIYKCNMYIYIIWAQTLEIYLEQASTQERSST